MLSIGTTGLQENCSASYPQHMEIPLVFGSGSAHIGNFSLLPTHLWVCNRDPADPFCVTGIMVHFSALYMPGYTSTEFCSNISASHFCSDLKNNFTVEFSEFSTLDNGYDG